MERRPLIEFPLGGRQGAIVWSLVLFLSPGGRLLRVVGGGQCIGVNGCGQAQEIAKNAFITPSNGIALLFVGMRTNERCSAFGDCECDPEG